MGMAVNTILTASKFAAGIIGHSHALIADAVESTGDILSSIILWRGIAVAAEPADRDHPYGHGKAEPLAAACVAIMMLLAGIGVMAASIWDMFQPHEKPVAFTLGILVGAIVLKEFLFRFVSREAGSLHSIALKTDAWHHRTDAIISLIAGIGIALTLFGGPHLAAADDIAAVIAGGIIAWNGLRLLRPAMDELMDAAPSRNLVAEIRSAASTVHGVKTVEKCIVRKMGFQYFVDMHVEVDPQMTVQKGHEIAHHVKDKVRAAVPEVHDVLVHVEPTTVK